MSRLPRLIAGLGIAGALLVGCGGSAKHDTVSMTPTQIVLAAQSATEKAGTAKLALSVETSVEGGESLTLTGSGAFDFAKRVGTMHSSFPNPSGGELAIDMVLTEATIYLKSDAFAAFAGKPWISVDLKTALGGNFSQLGTSDPSQGLAFLQGAKEVTLVGKEDVRGVSSSHYRATIDLGAALTKLSGGAKEAATKLEGVVEDAHALPIDVWVDGQNRVTRTVMTMRTKPTAATEGKATTSKVSTELYDYGTPLTVTIPPADQVADGSKILGGSQG